MSNALKGIVLFFKPEDFKAKFSLGKKEIIKEIRTEGIKVALEHYHMILCHFLGYRIFLILFSGYMICAGSCPVIFTLHILHFHTQLCEVAFKHRQLHCINLEAQQFPEGFHH